MKIQIQFIQYPMPSLIATTSNMQIAFFEKELPEPKLESSEPEQIEKARGEVFEQFCAHVAARGLLLSERDWIAPESVKRIWRV